MSKLSPKESTFISNILFTVVLGGLIGFFNYLFNIFVARYTSEHIFGIFSAAMGIIYLLQIPAFSIQALLTKVVGKQKNVNWKNFKIKSLLIFSSLGLIFSTIFFLSKDYVIDISSIPSEAIFPLSLVLLLAFISPISKGILLGKERIVTVNLLLLLETITKFVLGYFAIKMGGDITILILANAIPGVVFGLIALLFIRFDSKSEIEKKPVLDFKELILMTVSFLLLNLPYTLDLILVNPEFRADYSALTLVGKIVFFASTTISTVMFARLVNQKKEKNERRTLFISLIVTLLIGLGLSLFFYLFKDILTSIIFDGKYNGISTLIPLYSVCMALYASVYMAVNFLMSEGSYWFNIVFLFISGLQVYLFNAFNTDIQLVVRNQMIVYVLLFVLMCIILFFNIQSNGKKDSKEIV